MSFLKNFGIFTFFTLISRIFGLIRDIINARVLGANEISDAFFVAFRLPNLFRSIFAEGAMNSAFIPIFSKNFNSDNDANRFARKIYSILVFLLIFFCLLAYIFMPNILYIIAPGFLKNNSDELFLSSVHFARIMFPFLFFISLTALFGSILQTKNKFFPSSAYPIIMNIILILASFIPYLFKKITPQISLSYGVLLSGFLQMIFLIISAKIYKIELPKIQNIFSKLFFDEDVKIFFKRFLPAIFTTCITRIGITIDTIFASFVPSAVSYIYYADRLYQMPLSIIGTAISSIVLPAFSKALKDKSIDEIRIAQEKITEFALILILPASIGLFFMSNQICFLLFGEKFGQVALSKTSIFLSIISIALPFNVFNNILNSIFFANGKTLKITQFAILTLLFNVILNAILFRFFSFYSVAIATSASSIFNMFLLIFYAINHSLLFLNKDFLIKIKKIFLINLFILCLTSSISFFIFKINFNNKIYLNLFSILEICIIILLYFYIIYKKTNYKINYFKKIF